MLSHDHPTACRPSVVPTLSSTLTQVADGLTSVTSVTSVRNVTNTLAALALLALFRPVLGSWKAANCSLGPLPTPSSFRASPSPRAGPNPGAKSGRWPHPVEYDQLQCGMAILA